MRVVRVRRRAECLLLGGRGKAPAGGRLPLQVPFPAVGAVKQQAPAVEVDKAAATCLARRLGSPVSQHAPNLLRPFALPRTLRVACHSDAPLPLLISVQRIL